MILHLRRGTTSGVVDQIRSRLAAASGREVACTATGLGPLLRAPGFLGIDDPEIRSLAAHEAVAGVLARDLPFALASRGLRSANTVVRVGDVELGGPRVVIAAGPCSVESRDQLRRAAEAARDGGARLLRGGAFKPRTSPYSFQGLGEPGLELLAEVAAEFELKVVTEVMTPEQVPLVAPYAHMLQVGSRSSQNFPLLIAVGRQELPVLIKRGMGNGIDELLASAEYVMAGGNDQVVLCERGIRTFERRTRNTFDIAAIPLLRELSHLPVMADPSHGTGLAALVPAVGRAAVAAGADGILVEVHPDPARALSDGEQALRLEEFAAFVRGLEAVARAVGRSL